MVKFLKLLFTQQNFEPIYKKSENFISLNYERVLNQIKNISIHVKNSEKE